MRYILEAPFRLRGWKGSPTGLYHSGMHQTLFFSREQFDLLLRCDGASELEPERLNDAETEFLELLKRSGVIRPALFGEFLRPQQQYRIYPCRHRAMAEWSVTGACNLRCRHCFMSAPSARHGVPSFEQLKDTADQLAECGIMSVDITGGEPLTRADFPQILRLLMEREIGVRAIMTNGWLVDDALLDELEQLGFHPEFQLSFDGVGWHDFLRGIPGAEQKTLGAIRCLRRRDYECKAAMTLHKKNTDSLRDTVLLLASLGVSHLKCAAAMELGDWAQPEVWDLQLSNEEQLEIYERYIPQYFEDNAPMGINLSGAFSYTPGETRWGDRTRMYGKVNEAALSCSSIHRNLYIGADGTVAPCMGMADSGISGRLPCLRSVRLRDILSDSELVNMCTILVRDIRDRHPECRSCPFSEQCDGGCRLKAVLFGDGYDGIDPEKCFFFKSGWSERIRAAVQPALEDYLKRNGLPKEAQSSGRAAETGP